LVALQNEFITLNGKRNFVARLKMEGFAKPVGDDQLAFGGKRCRAHAESLTWLTLGFKGFFSSG
jgi:hypothetical protein